MTTTDINGTVSTGISLTSAVYSDPVTIDSNALVTASSTAIYSKYDWTIDNAGAIESNYIGIKLHSTATIINESTGTISGLNNAIKAPYGGVTLTNHGLIENLNTGGGSNAVYLQHTGVVLNTGTITATYRDGLIVSQGGSVTNTSGALIHGGSDGIKDDDNGSLTLDNAGTITAGRDKGLNLGGNKQILNAAGGVIHGHTYGIIIGSNSTIENAGTIIGDQIGIKMSSGDVLKVDAGAVFSGVVEGNGSTLELDSGASGGVISGFGVEYTGLGTIAIDSGAAWDIDGTTGNLEGTAFHNFHVGDRLDITDLSFAAGDTATYSSGHLNIYNPGHAEIASFAMTGSFGGHSFSVLADGNGGSFIEEDGVACYCRGTNLLTERGEVAVEHLRIGDMLVTASGAMRPIRWIGMRSYSGRFAMGNKTVQPIRIAAGALADDVPSRDLFVSPLHAMFLDGVLIPAQALINGTSITRVETAQSVEYFHIELESHDVIIAAGAFAESFIDDNSRGMFHNAADYNRLYPNAKRKPANYCAPIVEEGEELEAVRRGIAVRVTGESIRQAA